MRDEKWGLVLVHGSMGNQRTWKYQLEELGKIVKVLAIDLPGHGDNFSSDLPNMTIYVEFLHEEIQKHNIDKIILAGHSLGGAVVLSYYFQYPGKVKGLILIGTGARLRVLPIILELTKKDLPQVIKMMKDVAFHKETIQNNPQLIDEVSKEMSLTTPKIAHQDFSICNRFDVMTRIPEITVPTLIICGAADQLTPKKYSEYFHQHISQSNLCIIEKAGHMVMLEQPELVNKKIKEFIKGLDVENL
ncbi:MAG: alpha/beta fold hydrolase [Candidatus Helarchaeota archaeon]